MSRQSQEPSKPARAPLPLGLWGCLAAFIAGPLAIALVLLALLSRNPVSSFAAKAAWACTALAVLGMISFVGDRKLRRSRGPATGAEPADRLERAAGSPYDVPAPEFTGTVWIVWYEDQFSHDAAFATAFCFSEDQGYAAVKQAGGKLLQPGWDGYTVEGSTPEHIRWIFGVSKPDTVAELERRIRERDYRALSVPI